MAKKKTLIKKLLRILAQEKNKRVSRTRIELFDRIHSIFRLKVEKYKKLINVEDHLQRLYDQLDDIDRIALTLFGKDQMFSQNRIKRKEIFNECENLMDLKEELFEEIDLTDRSVIKANREIEKFQKINEQMCKPDGFILNEIQLFVKLRSQICVLSEFMDEVEVDSGGLRTIADIMNIPGAKEADRASYSSKNHYYPLEPGEILDGESVGEAEMRKKLKEVFAEIVKKENKTPEKIHPVCNEDPDAIVWTFLRRSEKLIMEQSKNE